MAELATGLGNRRQLSRTVWAVSLPILFAGVSETVIRVTDTAFLARVGTVELGAFALADTLLEVWLVPVIGLVEAMIILVGRRVGQQRPRAVRSTFVTGMLLILAVSTVFGATLSLGSTFFGGVVAESSTIGAAVSDYLRIAAIGLVFLSLNLGYAALYIGLARTRVLVATAIFVSITNFIGSYALILGRMGFPELGIEGAAWSFVAAEMAGFVWLTLHTRRHRIMAVPGTSEGEPLDHAAGRSLLRLSLPVALSALIESGRWLLFFMIMEQVSEEAVATANVVYACFVAMLIATDALADTTHSLVSNLIGRNEEGSLGRLLRHVIASNLVVSLPLIVVMIFLPSIPLWIFGLEGNDIGNTSQHVQLVAVGVLVMVPAEMWIAAVAGTGDTDAALGIEVAMSVSFLSWAYWALLVVGLPTAFGWLGVTVAAMLSLPLAYGWVRSGLWRRRRL